MSLIRNGVVAIERVTIAPNRRRRLGLDQLAPRRLGEQDEAEFARLAEQQAEPDARASDPAEGAASR